MTGVDALTARPGPTAAAALLARVTAAALLGELAVGPAPDPTGLDVSTAFITRQGVRHSGRRGGYRNEVLSVRVGAAVGSCAVDPGSLAGDGGETLLDRCPGRSVAELLADPEPALRTAVLDAYLAHARPLGDGDATAGVTVTSLEVPAGSSMVKSTARAAHVVDLLGARPGDRVLVVGVVNSLLAALRERGVGYVPCDRAGGETEWGEPVVADPDDADPGWDAVLATGMTLADGGLDALVDAAGTRPVTVFAQTGAAVFRELVAAGTVRALSAEPYPFFWLDGGPSRLHAYRTVPR